MRAFFTRACRAVRSLDRLPRRLAWFKHPFKLRPRSAVDVASDVLVNYGRKFDAGSNAVKPFTKPFNDDLMVRLQAIHFGHSLCSLQLLQKVKHLGLRNKKSGAVRCLESLAKLYGDNLSIGWNR